MRTCCETGADSNARRSSPNDSKLRSAGRLEWGLVAGSTSRIPLAGFSAQSPELFASAKICEIFHAILPAVSTAPPAATRSTAAATIGEVISSTERRPKAGNTSRSNARSD